MKERKKLSKLELCTKRKFILRRKEELINFRIKEKLVFWISGSKKSLFQRRKLVERLSFHGIFEEMLGRGEGRFAPIKNNKMILSLARILITKKFLFRKFWG